MSVLTPTKAASYSVYPRPRNHFSSNFCGTLLAAQRLQHTPESLTSQGMSSSAVRRIRVVKLAVPASLAADDVSPGIMFFMTG